MIVIVTGGKQSQLLAFALGLGWSLTTKTIGFDTIEINLVTICVCVHFQLQTSLTKTTVTEVYRH